MAAHDSEHPKGPLVLVDNDPETRAASKEALKREGYHVHAYEDGKRAIRAIENRVGKWKPAVIIIDLVLPELSGFQVVRRLCEKYNPKDIPILMTSKYMSPEDRMEARDAGALDLLEKPVSAEGLRKFFEQIRMRELKQQVHEEVFDITY